MIKGTPIITLSGSTKFKKTFFLVQKELSLRDIIVISVGLFGHADGEYKTCIDQEKKEILDRLHRRKIDLSDGIFVINYGGYIVESTKSEIEYAKENNKFIFFLQDDELSNSLTPPISHPPKWFNRIKEVKEIAMKNYQNDLDKIIDECQKDGGVL